VDFDSLASRLERFDVVIAALSKQDLTISQDMVRRALKWRRNRPVLLFDMAIPGDIEPGVDQLDDAFVWTLDDLEDMARNGRSARQVDAADAFRIVDSEVDRFLEGDPERAAIPLVVALRAHFEQTRAAVLAECGDDSDRATQLLVNRLLHDPSRALREMSRSAPAEDVHFADAGKMLAALFSLETEPLSDQDQPLTGGVSKPSEHAKEEDNKK
jgi:glutamyl-tRNA reductase